MEPQHASSTSGSFKPSAPSYKSEDAHHGNQESARAEEQHKLEPTPENEKETATQDRVANVRESHNDLLGVTEQNFAQYTSLLIAYYRATESKRDDAIMNDPYAELLAGDAGAAVFQFFSEWTPNTSMLGDYFALRTRSIDEALIHRDPAIQQIVILGAGLDSRAYRMDSLSDCLVIEVDSSASMMERKQKLLDEAGAHVLAKKHHVIIADLEQDVWATQLLAKGFDPKAPTFWLLEGLLYYMSKDMNEQLVRTINSLSAKHSQLWADMTAYALVANDYVLVKGGDGENEKMFRKGTMKYGEYDPSKGVLSQLQWPMKIQTSLDMEQVMFGREWMPMTVFSKTKGEEVVVPWFFVEVTKTQEQSE